MGKIRGRDYISWLWQYTAPYAGRIGLLLLFGLLETFASLAMVQITKEIIDHATVGSGFGRLLTGYAVIGNAGNLGVVDTAYCTGNGAVFLRDPTADL